MKRQAQCKRKYIGAKKKWDKYMLMFLLFFCTVTQEKKTEFKRIRLRMSRLI